MSKLDSAKADRNSAQAALYSALAIAVLLVIAGAVLYFVGGWLLSLAYNVLTTLTFVFGTLAILVGIFEKRKSVKELAAKYATSWHYYHSILGGDKSIEDFTPEEKDKIRTSASGWVLILSLFHGALWFLPLLTGLNPTFQILPLNFMALPAILFGIWITFATLGTHLNRLSVKNFDLPLNKDWSLKSYLFYKIGHVFLALYFVGIAGVVFGITSFPLLAILIAGVIFFLISIA